MMKLMMYRIESLLLANASPTCEVDDIHADGIFVKNSSVPRLDSLGSLGMKLR